MDIVRGYIAFCLIALLGCATPVKEPIGDSPKAPVPVVVLNHEHMEIHYAPKYRLAKFVKYRMSGKKLRSPRVKRKSNFVQDPLLKAQSLPLASSKDYLNSGYQRGHLAPSADFAWNKSANAQTFFMSNIAPQTKSLNQGAWKFLEEKVRRIACGEEEVIVITGPVLEPGLKTLASGIPIPNQFFKVVIDDTPPRKIIAFLFNQSDRENVTDKRIVSVKEIEAKINEDFSSDVLSEPLRQPAQTTSLSGWREAPCH